MWTVRTILPLFALVGTVTSVPYPSLAPLIRAGAPLERLDPPVNGC